MSWALCTQHPSWLPPSTLCTLEKSFTSSTRRQYCHWTIRAAIMFPSKCIFRNNIISWIQGCIFQLHRRPFSLLSDSLQILGGPVLCFALTPKIITSTPASDPLCLLTLSWGFDADCEELTHWLRWFWATWHFLVFLSFISSFSRSCSITPTPSGALSTNSPPPLVLHNQDHWSQRCCY